MLTYAVQQKADFLSPLLTKIRRENNKIIMMIIIITRINLQFAKQKSLTQEKKLT